MKKDTSLKTYWYCFPEDQNLPLGIGVTAFSQIDAIELIEAQGIDWHRRATKIDVKVGVKISDLDQSNIVPNIGPMQFRGVWFPCQNIGFGAPKSNEYKPLD